MYVFLELMMTLPDVDATCGGSFTFREFIECSETWLRTRVDNLPQQEATYDAMRQMAETILDLLSQQFARPRLTYAFASPALVHLIKKNPFPNIAPGGGQHAGCELNRAGRPICPRLGIPVDLYVPGVGSVEVATWIAANTAFDRLYFYSDNRPFHVSLGPDNSRMVVEMRGYKGGPHLPRGVQLANFWSGYSPSRLT